MDGKSKNLQKSCIFLQFFLFLSRFVLCVLSFFTWLVVIFVIRFRSTLDDGGGILSSFISPSVAQKPCQTTVTAAMDKERRRTPKLRRVAFTHTGGGYPGGNISRSPRQHPCPTGNVDLWCAWYTCNFTIYFNMVLLYISLSLPPSIIVVFTFFNGGMTFYLTQI